MRKVEHSRFLFPDQSKWYLFLNFSTRPPLWANFCCPVKNGWHAEQMSVLISSCVDLVINVLPHAQVTLHSLYSGWIPFFMLITSFLLRLLTIAYLLCIHSILMIPQHPHRFKPFLLIHPRLLSCRWTSHFRPFRQGVQWMSCNPCLLWWLNQGAL